MFVFDVVCVCVDDVGCIVQQSDCDGFECVDFVVVGEGCCGVGGFFGVFEVYLWGLVGYLFSLGGCWCELGFDVGV